MSRTPETTGSGQGSRASGSTPRSLLGRARAGEPEAWSRLVGLYAPLVYHWCRGWGLREQDAADVIQDVFQAIAAHLAEFQAGRPGDTFRGWVRTIARNKVNDHYRRQAREPGGAGGSEAQWRLAQLPDDRDADDPSGTEAGRDIDDDIDDDAEHGLFRRALALIRGEF